MRAFCARSLEVAARGAGCARCAVRPGRVPRAAIRHSRGAGLGSTVTGEGAASRARDRGHTRAALDVPGATICLTNLHDFVLGEPHPPTKALPKVASTRLLHRGPVAKNNVRAAEGPGAELPRREVRARGHEHASIRTGGGGYRYVARDIPRGAVRRYRGAGLRDAIARQRAARRAGARGNASRALEVSAARLELATLCTFRFLREAGVLAGGCQSLAQRVAHAVFSVQVQGRRVEFESV